MANVLQQHQPSKTTDNFPLLEACIGPSDTMKTGSHGGSNLLSLISKLHDFLSNTELLSTSWRQPTLIEIACIVFMSLLDNSDQQLEKFIMSGARVLDGLWLLGVTLCLDSYLK